MKRQKSDDEKWEIVEPKEFVLGVRMDTHRKELQVYIVRFL